MLFKNFESSRFTRDADALAVDIPQEKLQDMIIQALSHDLGDGLWFGDINVKKLEEQGKYGALRFSAAFQIGEPKKHKIHKLSRIHLDVGFGDQLVTEAKQESMLPLFSEHEPISWSIYPIEQIIAEKLETLFSRGPTNSRARDIYDLVHLLPRSKNDKLLLSSITITFEERNTPLPSSFAKEAQKLNSPVMEMAWNSVRVLKNKTSFAEIWETLLEYLKQFDKK